jgi:hypothetical protein
MMNYLESNIHKYVPGKRVHSENLPELGEIVQFIAEESERKRNERFKYGVIVEVMVDGRLNKVRIKYRNSKEVVYRETTRNVRDIVIIMDLEDLDFNTMEAQMINRANLHYMMNVNN